MPGEDNLAQKSSRRSFLESSAATLSVGWLMANWPQVKAAAHAAHESVANETGAAFRFLSTEEAADVEAFSAQIIPSGATPGAREAGVVHFIDLAFASFFAAQADDFRKGLTEFRDACQKTNSGAAFVTLNDETQHGYLTSVERTPFFGWLRFLTVAGLLASPKYGGNKDGLGWKLIGFEDNHVFEPPFGYYDKDYPGFVPYPNTGGKA
jgi:gluconate 2-dehydrogenase gamma chain